jgi:hypothetical protein
MQHQSAANAKDAKVQPQQQQLRFNIGFYANGRSLFLIGDLLDRLVCPKSK